MPGKSNASSENQNNSFALKLKSLFVAPEQKDRKNNINLLRFIDAAAVIAGHMPVFVKGVVPILGNQAVSTIGVMVFFLLSGYLISTSLKRDPNIFRYLVRRCMRIFPGLILVVTASVFIIGPCVTSLSLGEYARSSQTWAYLLNCVLNLHHNLPGVFDDPASGLPAAVNGSLWTLPVEFLMYLLLPCVLFCIKRLAKPHYVLLALALICHVIACLLAEGVISSSIVVWGTALADIPHLASFFCVGAAIAEKPEFLDRLHVQTGFLLLLLLAIFVPTTNWGSYTLLIFVLPYVTFAFALPKQARFGRVFAVHDYSYGIYLWGFPVQQLITHAIGVSALTPFCMTLLCFAVTLPLAMLSWFLIEHPGQKLGQKITAWSKSK
ncbi:MAG: acyltransferase [Coriobacteriales bacterium]|nr:acyltransferase [Coriobacteriales bacterium]